MSKYKNILFDLDGTVLDTYEGIAASFRYAFDKAGIDDQGIDIRRFIGPPLKYAFSHYTSDEDKIAEYKALYREYYKPKGQYMCSFYDGIKEVIAELRKRGYRTFVATSKPYKISVELMASMGAAGLFDAIYGAMDDASRSTKLSVLTDVITTEGLIPEECILIGDSIYDVEGAAAYPIDVAVVKYGFGCLEDMRKYKLAYEFDTAYDILKVFPPIR